VPLLIDQPRWPAHGRLWSHLVSDTSFGELHAFADRLGLPPRSFEGDHYDVPAEHYEAVVAAGARQVSMRELVIALHSSGLRRPKRKGERVLASVMLPDAGTLAGERMDLLASRLPSPVAPARIDVLVLRRGESAPSSLLVLGDRSPTPTWSLPGAAPMVRDSTEGLAARAVHQQTGVRLDASSLRIAGHARTMSAEPRWTTYLTTTIAADSEPSAAARWLPTDELSRGSGEPWWPLVDWLLDRRQHRSVH
jgi:ADP-ribose pyrophosphatase YjhB (NUDIX family)